MVSHYSPASRSDHVVLHDAGGANNHAIGTNQFCNFSGGRYSAAVGTHAEEIATGLSVRAPTSPVAAPTGIQTAGRFGIDFAAVVGTGTIPTAASPPWTRPRLIGGP
jgi:hypothetical protein